MHMADRVTCFVFEMQKTGKVKCLPQWLSKAQLYSKSANLLQRAGILIVILVTRLEMC